MGRLNVDLHAVGFLACNRPTALDYPFIYYATFQIFSSKNSESESLMEAMMKPSAWKPFILLLVMFTLQQACGGFAVVFYAVNVFQVPML